MIKVENVKAFQEDGEWFLKIVAKEVLDNKTYEVAIPKLRLPIENFRIIETECWSICDKPEYWINIGTDQLRLIETVIAAEDISGVANDAYCAYYQRLIEERPVEMTMAAIKKALGHPFKIVEEKK